MLSSSSFHSCSVADDLNSVNQACFSCTSCRSSLGSTRGGVGGRGNTSTSLLCSSNRFFLVPCDREHYSAGSSHTGENSCIDKGAFCLQWCLSLCQRNKVFHGITLPWYVGGSWTWLKDFDLFLYDWFLKFFFHFVSLGCSDEGDFDFSKIWDFRGLNTLWVLCQYTLQLMTHFVKHFLVGFVLTWIFSAIHNSFFCQ